MLTLSKKQIGNWVLLDYLSQKQVYSDKISFLEKKYDADLASFENQIKNASSEDFEAWDDLIEWKAYQQLLSEITAKITDIRNGDFQMAG
ncbi:hypothetical protein DYBT9623_00915 [Dyadobacter sp. CECT 9623]|uniref:Uncharacterized protein n=1 Tax=Dyadobacter linearis TaxID=2823330 RepID=A0ABM8UL41_9BACT|nr:hypothetical protein [Dyadobacter sp. CECT 9623]CAG5068186.1 hypothetical protein DYBT9623_00915 [Dyadobacter sp. CECT 9623]